MCFDMGARPFSIILYSSTTGSATQYTNKQKRNFFNAEFYVSVGYAAEHRLHATEDRSCLNKHRVRSIPGARHILHSMGKVKNRRVSGRMVKFALSSTSKGSLKHGLGAASQRKARGARNRGGDDTTTETALCGSTSILHLQARRPNSDWQMQFARPLKWLALLRKFDCFALRATLNKTEMRSLFAWPGVTRFHL